MKKKLFFICTIALSTLVNAQTLKTRYLPECEPSKPTQVEKPVNLGSTGFYENKGQIVDQNYNPNPGVKYLLCSPDFNVQLRQTGFSYDTYTEESFPRKNQIPEHSKFKAPDSTVRHYHRVDIELLGCNTASPLLAEDKSESYYNYFTSSTPKSGVSDVHYYQKVTYKNIYPNIDLEFMTRTVSAGVPVEYNFVVHPGGNPSDIKLAYKGANKVTLAENKLVVNVAAGDFTENIPSSYLQNSKQQVQVNYATIGNNTYCFSVSEFPPLEGGEALIIDPTPCLSWGTYYGGVNSQSISMALDASNNVYITGATYSATNVATAGAYQTSYGGNYDVFIAKFNTTGSSLLWGTYYGGAGDDLGYGIILDALNNVYVTGNTGSTGMATVGAHQTVYAGGGSDAFVAKFNSTGSSLLWSTYYGGTGSEAANGIILDASDNVYITGFTGSNTGIATAGAYQTIGDSADGDAFLAKFNATGSTLVWGTYYGGNMEDWGYGINIDASNNVYITGFTQSNTGIATAGVYQTNLAGSYDVFVAKFNPTGSALLWGTYYGGSNTEYGYGIAVDAGDNVYITGYTTSTAGIATAGAYQVAFVGPGDAFVAKFNTTGTTLLWGTYYEGSAAYSIVLDAADNIYITGSAGNRAGVTTVGAYQTIYGGGNADGFVAKFNTTGTSLLWGTYYGGTSGDYPNSIALDASDNIYITGFTYSSNAIATAGAYQTVYTGGTYLETFVAKFGCNFLPLGATITSQTNVSCLGQCNGTATVAATGGTGVYHYNWTPSGGTSSTASNLCAGTYTCTVTDTAANTFTVSVTITQPASSLAVSISSQTNVNCSGGTGNATANGATGGTFPYNYDWAPSGGTNLTASNLTAGTYTITATDNHGCNASASVTITQPPALTSVLKATPDTICKGSCSSIEVNPGGGSPSYTYSWSNGATTSSANVCPVATTTYTSTVTDANGCSLTASATVTVNTCAGINEINGLDDQVNFYPNPFSQSVNVDINVDGPVTITMFNMLGENMGSWLMDKGLNSISTNTLPSGVYFMQIKTINGILNKKLIKIN